MLKLKPLTTLKEQITKLPISASLENEINIFMQSRESHLEEKESFENLLYRANLHFIIENYTDERRVIRELKTLNYCK